VEEIKEELKVLHQLVSGLPILGKDSFVLAEILTRLSKTYEIADSAIARRSALEDEEKETAADPK
jgi:hypothetical protein